LNINGNLCFIESTNSNGNMLGSKMIKKGTLPKRRF
jgi:hypothetical protein